jgi:hypothetical protein
VRSVVQDGGQRQGGESTGAWSRVVSGSQQRRR